MGVYCDLEVEGEVGLLQVKLEIEPFKAVQREPCEMLSVTCVLYL